MFPEENVQAEIWAPEAHAEAWKVREVTFAWQPTVRLEGLRCFIDLTNFETTSGTSIISMTCSNAPFQLAPPGLFLSIAHASFHARSHGSDSWRYSLEALQYLNNHHRRQVSMQAHLLHHRLEDLIEHKAEIAEAGYDIPSGYIICPFCNQTSADCGKFEEHIKLDRLVADREHFTAWRSVRLPTLLYGNWVLWDHTIAKALLTTWTSSLRLILSTGISRRGFLVYFPASPHIPSSTTFVLQFFPHGSLNRSGKG
ncbi:hypothetical protein FGG08_006528 [Glutinoglossum americanum]|uniref:Uncharacterized protein n=1 Tax=Glutinoglossum americanum TaxID=1670608 RepID=A0A9P8I768_9PEZI|nr:hypothetical protein FGG08_006528 [Glutinoglossum americanum]